MQRTSRRKPPVDRDMDIDEQAEEAPQRHRRHAEEDSGGEKKRKGEEVVIGDIAVMSFKKLREYGENNGMDGESLGAMRWQEAYMSILRRCVKDGCEMFGEGALELMSDGYGFLRARRNSYLQGPEDVFVSASQVRRLHLRRGDYVVGQLRSPKDGERFFSLQRATSINDKDPGTIRDRERFDNLKPLYPDKRFDLETKSEDISTRMINLFCPIGKGQRGLIVSPPRTGKTILLQKVANAITTNNPEIVMIILLIDERPEEVTDMERNVDAEVISSTFDEQASRHVHVAEMVLERARRLVEQGNDVVILLDSITRLARAYNQTVPASGKILSGGVDSNALHRPKRFFGAARNIEGGGSLTIVATALIETGSRMDEVIFEEFKGTGNMEINLDRKISDRRLYPAINVKKSGTRREDLLLSPDELQKLWVLRKVVSTMDDVEVIELLINRMKKSTNNEEFLKSMNTTGIEVG